jgi:hypothetical protein
MGRWLVAAAVVGSLGACSSFSPTGKTDPARTVIGVSAPQVRDGTSTAAQPAAIDMVQWKADQICTHGIDRINEDAEPAEEGKQLVDWQLRCTPYRLSVFGPIPNWWPF